ncbi:MAG: thymidine phosphorylase [Pseudomonadota bacterium]
MDARLLIDNLRQGIRPSPDALAAFAQGLGDGRVSDAQAGAFAMAVCLQGLGEEGRVALTKGMRDSGDVMNWDLPGPVLDKHSTGGVGDAVSLLLAPMLAALGAFVPMISGRGLGHTGGTLDKLEAIPGVSTKASAEEMRAIVRETGAAIVGPTDRIAPADGRLYRIRDVSGTVPSLDLITASILSKKLAAGLGALVLDVKVGSGAIMRTPEDAKELAQSLVKTANGAGCPTCALVTDMSQPLLPSLGNALEIHDVLSILRGEARGPIVEVALALGAELLVLARVVSSEAEANLKLTRALESGRAADRFAQMIAAQGGPSSLLERPGDHLASTPVQRPVPAPAGGYLASWDGTMLGHAVVELGGGRRVETDQIDPAVGLSHVAPIGTSLEAGAPLAFVHAATEEAADAAAAAVFEAARISADRPAAPDLIHDRIMP